VVHGQVEAAVEDDRGAVGPVKLGDRGAALEPSRVAGHRDHGLEDGILGEQVEEVAGPGKAVQALLDDPEERVERGEVGRVRDGLLHSGSLFLCHFQAGAVLAANSAKVIGAVPVTAPTSPFGRAPFPLATAAVRGRRTWAYSAG